MKPTVVNNKCKCWWRVAELCPLWALSEDLVMGFQDRGECPSGVSLWNQCHFCLENLGSKSPKVAWSHCLWWKQNRSWISLFWLHKGKQLKKTCLVVNISFLWGLWNGKSFNLKTDFNSLHHITIHKIVKDLNTSWRFNFFFLSCIITL